MSRAAEIAKYAVAYREPSYRMGAARRAAAVRDLQGLRGSLLDVGCGRGEMLKEARRLGLRPVRGTEVVRELLDYDVDYAQIHDLPFADGAFDHVTCFDVLEHLTPADTVPGLLELFRVASKTVTVTVADYPHMVGGVELHVNRRPYAEWLQLFQRLFQGVTELGEAGASRSYRFDVRAGRVQPTPMRAQASYAPPARRPFEELRGRHRGATFIVLGGGSSLAEQMLSAPEGIRISANEHGCKWGRCDYVAAMDDIADKVRPFGIPVIGRMPETCDYLAEPFPDCRWTGTQAVYCAYVMGAHQVVLAGMDLYQDQPEGTPGGRKVTLETHLEAWQIIHDRLPMMVRALGGPLTELFGLYDPNEAIAAPGVLPPPPVATIETVRVRCLAGGAIGARRYREGTTMYIRPDELAQARALGLAERIG